ncbi:hypothetical protein [Desertibacillus haloalkaliphilus]|uniref:hypothetical protein n=1 Tax=Desertibacillus haloalkaliphilus TaxID=1328930 RepID=UPI001C25CFD3|nr:hypothetical protein [Desertibacillus haloalkaliphilus]MBU8905043.1 hypothetical protein [Desertibacillus haloalkaliphilus]
MNKEDRRISIKLNGQEQSYEEIQTDHHDNNEERTYNLTEEQLPTVDEQQNEQPDTPRTKIIDFGKKLNQRKKNRQPFWDDGNREKSPKLPYKRKKKKHRNHKRFSLQTLPVGLLVSVVSAIIVGLSFGFMVLTVFTNEPSQQDATLNGTSGALPVTSELSEVPTLQAEVIQGGAFSTSVKGNEIVTSLNQAGYPAVLTEGSDPVYMFIGLGQDREQATAISDYYKSQGQETYIKSFAVPATGANIESTEAVNFFVDGVAIWQELIALSVNGIAGNGSLINAENVQSLNEQHQHWQQTSAVFFESAGEQIEANAKPFTEAIATAVEQVSSYQQQGQASQMWGVQQSLLQAMLAYEALMDQLSVS